MARRQRPTDPPTSDELLGIVASRVGQLSPTAMIAWQLLLCAERRAERPPSLASLGAQVGVGHRRALDLVRELHACGELVTRNGRHYFPFVGDVVPPPPAPVERLLTTA